MGTIVLTMLFISCSSGFLLLAGGCASSSSQRSAILSQRLPSAADYLAKANQTSGVEQQTYRLNAVNRLLQTQHIAQAQRLLANMNKQSLPTTLAAKKQLLEANIAVLTHNNDAARQDLQQLAPALNAFSIDEQIAYHQLLAYVDKQSQKNDQYLSEQLQLLRLLTPPPARRSTIQASLQYLQSLPTNQLKQWLQTSTNFNVRGFIALALMMQQGIKHPNLLPLQLANWRATFPNHPGNELLPAHLPKATTRTIHHIALLLPLQSSLAPAAHAIENGFFSAYYHATQTHQPTPIITVYNTNQSTPIQTLYAKAIADGADCIVGPLQKSRVATLLASAHINTLTLVLNTLPANATISPNLYSFALSPKDDIEQLSAMAWNKDERNALILTANNAWGQEIAQEMSQYWTNLGGHVVGNNIYGSQSHLAQSIKHALHIDQSQADYRQLRRILHEKLRFIPRRRKDIDMIVLIANPLIARQIKPLLSYYFAGNIPLYATSQIFHGQPNPAADNDLNGILFVDMPWALTPNHLQPPFLSMLYHKLEQDFPNAFQHYPKLYAFGIDAYDVLIQLNIMAMLPQIGTPAATGTLYITADHQIKRQLLPATISHGTPVLLQSIHSRQPT